MREKAFLIPKEIVMHASIITPVMREDAARVTSCFFRASSTVWNDRNVK